MGNEVSINPRNLSRSVCFVYLRLKFTAKKINNTSGRLNGRERETLKIGLGYITNGLEETLNNSQ